MKNNIQIEEDYNSSKKLFHKLNSNINFNYEDISSILYSLDLNEKNNTVPRNNLEVEELSNLLKLYMDELTKCFKDDEKRFHLLFNCYILLIETYTELAILYSGQKEFRKLVNKVFALLKESKNMIKLFIPLEEEKVNLLNNYLGRQLYHYAHLHYVTIKNKDIEYVLEEHLMQIEGMLFGFELCVDINFANSKNAQEINEKMVLINNISFVLLKMIYKLKFREMEKSLDNNPSFVKIIEFFEKISLLKKEKTNLELEDFKALIFKNFKKSATHLLMETKKNMFKEKSKLLEHNTDEYKQLIDIITVLKNNWNY